EEGILDLLGIGADLVLDGQLDKHKHVVLGLSLDLRVQLLDLKAHPACDALHERRLALEPRSRDAHEFAEALDDRALLLLYGEKEERHFAPPWLVWEYRQIMTHRSS